MAVFARGWRAVWAPVLTVLLAACGGSGDGSDEPAVGAGCDVASQNTWLRGYMSDWYYWSGAAPDPDPTGFTTVSAYFEALRYTGSGSVPADRWSYIEDSAAYNQFFEEGRTLGYGVFVNGLELALPLKLRYVEPLSPAAAAGLKRGDVIVSLDGRSAADLIADDDFALLTPAAAGDVLTVVIEDGAGTRTVALTAATYDLTPVSGVTVLPLPNGRKAGYLVLKDFITQAEAPLADAFAQFGAAGATELILDLRYNGGGRVSTSNVLASLVAGANHGGGVFARLTYNDRHRGSDRVFQLTPALGPAFARVVVLTGPRTCSASELLVNGLRPFVDVVTIGDATCGKPFGFNPVESCGSTFSAVNFESFNALGEGRYYDGIGATCEVGDDFSGELGDPAEKLTAAAARYVETGVCPAVSSDRPHPLSAARRRAAQGPEPGERRGMIAD
jgi:carboxyl-terminal processing protease